MKLRLLATPKPQPETEPELRSVSMAACPICGHTFYETGGYIPARVLKHFQREHCKFKVHPAPEGWSSTRTP